jgi:hypothetical protein
MNKNRYLLTLVLKPEQSSLEKVKGFSGLRGVEIDEKFGVISISPEENLYVIRVSYDSDPDRLISRQPEVKGVYGDARIAAMR